MRSMKAPIFGLLAVLALLSAGCGRAVREQIRNPLPELEPTAVLPEATPVIDESSEPAPAEAQEPEQVVETPTAVDSPAEASPQPTAAPAAGLDPTAEAQAAALENLLNGLIEQNEAVDSLDDLP